jgi:hypothetical protein
MMNKRTKNRAEDFAAGVGRALRSAAKEAEKIARLHNTSGSECRYMSP